MGSRGHLHGRARGALLSLLLLGLAQPAFAHETGLSYLRIRVDDASLEIEVDLGLGDAAAALGLASERDPNADPESARALLWERIASRADELEMRDAAVRERPRAPCHGVRVGRRSGGGASRACACRLAARGRSPCSGSRGAILSARRQRVDLELGPGAPTVPDAAFVDTCATIGAFNVVDRIADATGIPLDPTMLAMSEQVRDELDLARFGSSANTPGLGPGSPR